MNFRYYKLDMMVDNLTQNIVQQLLEAGLLMSELYLLNDSTIYISVKGF